MDLKRKSINLKHTHSCSITYSNATFDDKRPMQRNFNEMRFKNNEIINKKI